MSAGTDFVTNALDLAAFTLAGAEVFGKEKLREGVERVASLGEKLAGPQGPPALNQRFLFWLFMCSMSVAFGAVMLGVYTGHMRTGITAATYIVLGLVCAVLGVIFLGIFAHGYRHLLTLYDQPLALLKAGAALFVLARVLALGAAWGGLPSAADFWQFDKPTVRLGVDFEQWRAWQAGENAPLNGAALESPQRAE